MALEDVHLDVLQNIEFAIVSVYRKQHALRDVEVMRALDALIDVYRAKARGHTPKEVNLPEPENTVFQQAYTMCEFRLGRQETANRHPPLAGCHAAEGSRENQHGDAAVTTTPRAPRPAPPD